MENKKVQYLINIINDMDLKDKLRLAICMSQSKWAGLIYNTKENYEKFDKILKEVDEEYRTTFINFSKYGYSLSYAIQNVFHYISFKIFFKYTCYRI